MNKKHTSIGKLWLKLPLIFRAIILGFLISTLGVFTWGMVATFVPMPWAFILMIPLLWLFIKYFGGWGKPKSTQEFRKENFRKKILNTQTWIYASLAIVLIIVIEQAGLILTFRVIDFPAERFTQEYAFLNTVPSWAAWLVILMISAVAGISEEIGFRGYMQAPLEKKYGPIKAIAAVSIVFVLVHLHQAWSGPILVHIFFISVLFGSLAYFTNSLIPGIIAHFLMDICNFTFWWSDLGYQFDKQTISHTGIDVHFILWTLAFILSVLTFIYLMRKLIPWRDK